MPTPRKTQAEHALHGTEAHDRTSDVSHVPAGRPKFPRDLDSSLRPIFKRLCKLLSDRRVLTAGDAELVRLYCFQFDRHSRNVALLRSEQEITTYTRLDNNGCAHQMVKPNYRLKVVTDAERMMAGILAQLGLTQTTKDRAKPVKGAPTNEIVPGSIADLHPEWLKPNFREPEPVFVMPSATEIAEDPDNGDE
jgi:P27 family predicted phage terminase small subunit